MKSLISKSALAALALLACNAASADFGVGLKAGTLGLGLEGRWSPLPWLDVRMGINSFEYDDNGSQAGVNYDATFSLDTYYATGNFRFPLSPFRVTAGVVSNGNEFAMVSQDTGGLDFTIGNDTFSAADVGTLQSVTSFGSTAPYVGVGYDFEIFGKVGLNLDFGVLWQGEPEVTLEATGLASAPPVIQTALATELENERLELEDEMSDFKAWPVLSLGFVYNF
ncbi:MAG: hypothetical protein WBM76_07760, partial [Woeseiaceae bacterium]